MIFVINWENKNTKYKLNTDNKGTIFNLLKLILYNFLKVTTNVNFKELF